MDEFPSNANSDKLRAEATPVDKKIEKVITGDIVIRKPPFYKKLFGTFFEGDLKGTGQFVVLEVLIPAARDAVADGFQQGLERMMYGEVKSINRRSRSGSGLLNAATTFVNYGRYSQTNNMREPMRDPRPQLSRQARAQHDFQEIVFATRPEAETVYSRMLDLLEKYQTVSVRDFYDLVGAHSEYTDDNWGWTDLRGSDIRRVSGGYLILLPPTQVLEK